MQNSHEYATLQVPVLVLMKIQASWDVKTCPTVKSNRRFRGNILLWKRQ